jgi:hypothetical protein
VKRAPDPSSTAMTERVLLPFRVPPHVVAGRPSAGCGHGPAIAVDVAQFAGLSVPKTTYIRAGWPALIPASGSSPRRSETPYCGNDGSGVTEGFAYAPCTGVDSVRKRSVGQCWFGGISLSSYGATGRGGGVRSGELAIASLPSSEESPGQRVEVFAGPHGRCVVAPEFPNSHHTRPPNSNGLPLSPESSP